MKRQICSTSERLILKENSTFQRPLTFFGAFCIECPKGSNCKCSESEDSIFDWGFSEVDKTRSAYVSLDGRQINFHPNESRGTACIRGTKALSQSMHHFWEFQMTSPMFGTDVMLGIATKDARIDYEERFVSALGIDAKSWGFSYTGIIHHDGKKKLYAPHKWSAGVIVGIHFDRWRGTMELYVNRKPLGIAFKNIPCDLELYPVISSTAAITSMRLICAQCYPCNLTFEAVSALSKQRFSSFLKSDATVRSKTRTIFESLPPGLAKFININCWYLFGTRMTREVLSKQIKPFRDNPNWKALSDSSSENDSSLSEMSGVHKKSKKSRTNPKCVAIPVNSDSDDSDITPDRFVDRDKVTESVDMGSTSSRIVMERTETNSRSTRRKKFAIRNTPDKEK